METNVKKDDSAELHWTCEGCEKSFEGEMARLLECEYRFQHVCIDCLKISDEDYMTMTKKKTPTGFALSVNRRS